MKRIAFVNQRYGTEVNGGSEYYTRLMAERLADRYEVEVLTTRALDYVTWENYYENDTEIINGVLVRRFKTDKKRAADFNAYNEKYLSCLAKTGGDTAKEKIWFEKQGPVSSEFMEYIRSNSDKYDVFIFVTYLYYLTVMGLPEVSGKAILIPTAHEEPYIHFRCYRDFFRLPSGFIFLTDEEKELVHGLFDNADISWDVMGTGVDVPAKIDPESFKKRHGLDRYIIYVGRIDEGKNCPLLFRYFSEYKKRTGDDLKLVLMGKPVCDIPESEDIISLGFVSEQEKFDGIAGAQMLVLPSRFESLSISVLEAMSLGVPVLVNGMCDVLKGHCIKSNGGLYYMNYFEFEGCLGYIRKNPRDLLAMGDNAEEYIEKNYRWDVITDRFSAFIEKTSSKSTERNVL
ncbi:MAG: glycosyltransferase family 4 protein [Ruminococcus sp.]|nr:glycosyltransferase family 4 protein [Ruminococcus sp.]